MRTKNGFTLIELLAVIVVLAIIMVIATQQVNKTIKKSRTNAYYDSVLSIKKSSKLACTQNDLNNIKEYIDKTDDINVTVSGNNINITINKNGKFSNIDENELNNKKENGVTFSEANSDNDYLVTIINPCELQSDTYNQGDVISLHNAQSNKSEDFYVISDNGSVVTALAKYNLLIGNEVVWDDEFDDVTSVTKLSTSEEGYGLQSSIAAGYSWDSEKGLPTTNKFKGVMAFANGDATRKKTCKKSFGCYYGYWVDASSHSLLSKYGTSYPTNVFDNNSLLYEPLQNYENYLKNTLGKSSVKTKLLTYDDVIDLGCTEKDHSCKSAPSWLGSTNFWLASAAKTRGYYNICFIDSDKYFSSTYFDDPGDYGLRPVITINKSDID